MMKSSSSSRESEVLGDAAEFEEKKAPTTNDQHPEPAGKISSHVLEILKHVIAGDTDSETAAKLGVTLSTVHLRTKALLNFVGVFTTKDLISMWREVVDAANHTAQNQEGEKYTGRTKEEQRFLAKNNLSRPPTSLFKDWGYCEWRKIQERKVQLIKILKFLHDNPQLRDREDVGEEEKTSNRVPQTVIRASIRAERSSHRAETWSGTGLLATRSDADEPALCTPRHFGEAVIFNDDFLQPHEFVWRQFLLAGLAYRPSPPLNPIERRFFAFDGVGGFGIFEQQERGGASQNIRVNGAKCLLGFLVQMQSDEGFQFFRPAD